jgi:tight adherence protein B
MLLLLAMTVAAAAALAVPAPGPLSATGQRLRGPAREGGPRRFGGGRLGLVATGLVAGGTAAAGLRGTHLTVALIGVGATVFGLHLAAGAAQARAAAARRLRVIDFCEALVGELQAGQPQLRALERSARAWPESGGVAAAAALGADIPEALRRVSRLPGATGVARLAAGWEICAETGGGLAFAAEQVLETARAESAGDRFVQAELASARATGRLMTVLPLVVLLAAQGIGARPWQFLLSTAPGVVCLGLGVTLALAGLWWIDRIAAGAVGER